MHRSIAVLILMLACIPSCKDHSTEIAQSQIVTTEPNDTLYTALIDGKQWMAWSGDTAHHPWFSAVYHGPDWLFINGKYHTDQGRAQDISIRIAKPAVGTWRGDDVSNKLWGFWSDSTIFYIYPHAEDTVTITTLDTINNIVSGTFKFYVKADSQSGEAPFHHVTNGRFNNIPIKPY